MSPDEQRQAPRITRGFMIRYRFGVDFEAGWLVSPLLDLSATGARFLSERPFKVNAPLAMQLILPTSKAPVTVTGRVVRTTPSSLGMMELGVAFDPLDPKAQEILGAAVAHFLRHKSGAT